MHNVFIPFDLPSAFQIVYHLMYNMIQGVSGPVLGRNLVQWRLLSVISHEVVVQSSVSPEIMMVYLFDESSSLERALVAPLPRHVLETQRSPLWRAFKFSSQGSSGGVIMEVRFLMASACCPLVDFVIDLNYVWHLGDGMAQDDTGHTRKLPKMRDGDHKRPSTIEQR